MYVSLHVYYVANMQLLTEFCQLIVEDTLNERAYNRETWQDHLSRLFTGAIREFYKARLAEKNKLAVAQDIFHWDEEVEKLLDEAKYVYHHSIKGFKDREKAFIEVRSRLARADAERRRKATHIIEKYYVTSNLVAVDDNDTLAFWNLVQDVVIAGEK